MKKVFSFFVLIISVGIILTACGGGGDGGGGGTGLTTPATNISGTWNTTETKGTNTCGDTPGSVEYSTATITQTPGSNNFTITSIGRSFTGAISGTHLSYSGPADNPECPLGFTLSVSLDLEWPNYTSATGSAEWSCQYTGGSCTGTTNITATKQSVSDTTSPTTPTGLTATSASSSQINLSWNAPTDDVGVAGYKIYRGGAYLTSVTMTSASDTGLSASTPYCYTVSAYDAANNESPKSAPACATTQSLWTGTKQLGTTADDVGNGVAVDAGGNVYVTGYTYGGLDGNTSAGSTDIFLVKYDAAGTKQWTRQLGTTADDIGYGIAVDAGGNVYVTGYTSGSLDGNTSAGSGDIFLVKYNAAGTKQWTKQFGTTADDRGYGVAVDAGGNVYVTGYTNGGLDGNTSAGSGDIFLVKYDAAGAKQWTKQFGTTSNDEGWEVAVDAGGNVYVTGYTNGGLDGNTNAGLYDMFLVKYNAAGTKQWTRQLGTTLADIGIGVVVDAGGNIYVTGYTNGSLDGNISLGNYDMFFVKYDASGTKQWTKQLGTTADDRGYGIAVDAGGNAYVTGYTGGNLDGNTSAGNIDIFLVKYNAAGTKQWTKQLGTTSDDYGFSVAVDAGGNAYVTGYTSGSLDGNTSAGSGDIFLVKYNTSGIKQ